MSFEALSIETVQNFAHHYGYWAVLLGILLENLGLPLPGEAIVLVGGFLAGEGELKYGWVLCSAIAGAVVGGTCGYWVGVYGGWPLLLRVGQFFKVEEERLLEIKHRFGHNAARTVFLGRFVTLLRIFASPLAGTAGMSFGRFMIYNGAGALLWAAVMVTLAFFAGELLSLDQLIVWVGQFGMIVLGGVLAWLIGPWLLRVTRKGLFKQPASDSEPS
jgi:membrane-associated protein